MGTAANLYTRIYPQGKGAKGLYYGGSESKYAILGGGGEVIHDKMEYSLNPRQSSNSAAAQGQTFTTSNLITGSGTHGNGASISGISISPSTIEIDANPSSSSTREIRRTVSQVHNAYGVGYTGASCELVFSQGRDYVSSMTLTLGTPSVIAAGGGSVNSCSYTLTVNWVSGKRQTYDSKIPDGATINWTGVTAGSKGTTISNQTTAGTLSCTVSFDGKTANDSATVYQVANSVISGSRVYDAPTFILASSYEFGEDGGSYTINPSDGRQTYTDTYTSGSQSTGSTTLSGTYSYTTQKAAAGFSRSNNIVSVTKNTAITERGGFVVRVTLTANGKSSYKDMTFSQEAASLSGITWTVQLTYADVSAGGGTVQPQLSYTLSYLLNGEQITIQSGATITYEGASNANGDVTADNLGTTIQNRSLVATVTVKLSYSIDGELTTTSKTVPVYQAGNYVTSIDLTGFAIAYSKSVSAAGGTVSPTVTNGTVRYYFSSGSNGTATPSSTYGLLTSAIIYSGNAGNGFSAPNATTGAMTASNRDTVTGSSRNSGTVTATRTVTWTPSGSYNSSGVKSDSMSNSDYATQVANSVISSSRVYDAPTFSMASSYEFGEDGGSYTISPSNGRQTYTDTYTSGSQSTGSTTLSGTYTYAVQASAAGFSLSGNKVTVTKNTVTTARGGFVVRVTLSASGKSSYKDITFSQEAASLNAEGWSISLTYSDIPAGGGSVSPNLTYTFTYVLAGTAHHVTSGAVVSYDYDSGIVSASTLGTTEKGRTLIRTIKVTLSYVLNGQTYTGSTTANVYQEANIMESRVYDAPTFSLASSYTFGEDGGSYTISPSNGKQTYTDTYTSGSQSTGSTTVSGVYNYTTQTAAAGFSRSNNIVSVTKNTATTERGGFVVRVTLTANGKSSYKDITFSQEAASLNVEGWSISLTYSDIPAAGGSVSPNLSYTFTYVSGGTTHRVTSGAGVSYDYNNGVVSASNLGTTEKSRALIRTIKVTLSYVLNGQTYTGSTTANVYQEANIATQEYLVKIWGTRGYEDKLTAFSYTFVNGNTSYDGDALGFSPFIWNDHKIASDIPIYLTLAERSTYSSGEIGNYIPLTPSLIRTDNINGTGSLLDAYQMEISFTPNLFPKNLEGAIVISGKDTEEFTIKMTQVRTSYYLFVDGTYTPFDENCECTLLNYFKSTEANYTFKICGDPEGSINYPDGNPVFLSDSAFELDEQPSWITDTKDNNETIIVTFEENITGRIRNGQLVFGYQQEIHGLNPYDREGRRFNFYVNVRQAALQDVLEISPSTNTITGTGKLQFTVKSSSNWTAELEPALIGGKSPYTYATINPSSGRAGETSVTVNIFDNYEDTSSTAATITRILFVRCENQEGAHDTANITQLGVRHRTYNLCVNRDGYYSCMAGVVTSNNPDFEISDTFNGEGDSFKFQISDSNIGTLLESSEEPTMVLSPSNAGNISYANGEFSVEINEGNVVSRDITAKVTYNDEIHSYFNGPYSIKFSQEPYGLNYVYMDSGNTHFRLFITNDSSGRFIGAQVQIGLLLMANDGQTYEPYLTYAPNSEGRFFDPVDFYGVNIPKNSELVILALHIKVANFSITDVSNPYLGLQIDSSAIRRTTTTGELLARFTANYPEYTNPVTDGVCEFDCYNLVEDQQFALTDGDSTILSNTGTITLHIMNN